MPTYGENESLTFGEMEGPPAPEPERRVSGPAGVCICGEQSNDPECPAHGHGPTTQAGTERVRDALVAQQEATGVTPAGVGIIRAGAEGEVGGTPGGLPPLGTSRRVSEPDQIAPGQPAPNIADFPIEQAAPEQLKGSVYRIVRDYLEPLVRAAVMQHSMGERVGWEMVACPAADEDGNMTMGFMLFLSLPGLVLGTSINNSIIFNTVLDWDQDKISVIVGRLLQQAFDGRSNQVAEMQQAQQASRAMGNGLILPGR